MRLNASRPIRWIAFDVFLGLFIFVSFNREMAIAGIESRYVLVLLAVICLLFTVHDSIGKIGSAISGLEKAWILYYVFVILSFTVIIVRPYDVRPSSFYDLAILHGFNILTLLLVIMNKKFLRLDGIAFCLCLSGIVLAISQIAVYVGIDIDMFMKDPNARVMAVDLGQGEHFNLFGQPFRVSGFAEDPNYACLFNIITIAMAVCLWRKHKRLALVAVLLSLVGISLAWSRTVVFGALGCGLVLLCAKLLPQSKKAVYTIFVCAVVPVALMLPFLHIDILQTVTTRYTLWLNAYDLFNQSPWFGNGLTSFRSYNASLLDGWYVHPHSSFWETLAEFGIFAFAALIAVFVLAVRRAASKPAVELMILIMFVFSVNFDCTYLQISILVLAVLPLSMDPGSLAMSVVAGARTDLCANHGAMRKRRGFMYEAC